MLKNCAVIHDLSCYAKSSLTVVAPILEAMGIEACPLPTALLSTQTDGFEGFFYQDLSAQMEAILKHWNELGLHFDSIYSGFLGAPQQIQTVLSCIRQQRTTHSPLVLVDPVMGDHGLPYGPMDERLIQDMRSLVKEADVITPNTTEVALLLGREWTECSDMAVIKDDMKRLSDLGPSRVVITSVLDENGDDTCCSVAYYDRDTGYEGVFTHDRIPVSYPGSGDLFASLLCGQLLWQQPFAQAVVQSAKWVSEAIQATSALGYPSRHGIAPSVLIPTIASLRPRV